METSIMKRAQEKGLFEYTLHNLTDWTVRNTRRVDDRPYGGWAGTIITIEPLVRALRDIQEHQGSLPIYLMTPTGKILSQELVETYSENSWKIGGCIIICGHYEWIDERIFDFFPITPISIWEYVLSSGELAGMVFIDAMVRLLPGVISDESREEDSFSASLERKKEYPQYSRPEIFEGISVPKELLSGDQKKVRAWKNMNIRD